jgi:hypothetical protein
MESCKNAIIYHCKNDDECSNKDIIWQLLKDADALDRGRFGHPQGTSNIKKSSKGCNIKFFRLTISAEFKEKLAWSAYWLASITRNTNWTDNSFKDIKQTVSCGLQACLRNGILNHSESQTADKMINLLKFDIRNDGVCLTTKNYDEANIRQKELLNVGLDPDDLEENGADEEEIRREKLLDMGLDPDDSDFGELAPDGLYPEDIDWDSFDYE